MHTPFSLPWLQPGLAVLVPEDTDYGVAGSEAVLDRTGQGRLSQELGSHQLSLRLDFHTVQASARGLYGHCCLL